MRCHFKNQPVIPSSTIHLLFFIGKSETALRVPVTMLASEEKPCY